MEESVRLRSHDGAFVELRPVGYEFARPAAPGPGKDWDANWLVLRGQARTPDGRSWSFEDPCLTTWEARSLLSWLRGVVSGTVPATPFDGSAEEQLLVFTEPVVSLSLAERTPDAALIRVHLSLEGKPPWLQDDDNVDIFEYFLPIDAALNEVSCAADDWEHELEAFPER